MAICGHFWLAKISYKGQICTSGSEHARDFILMSIPRFYGMGNSLGPFSDMSDWPKWPKQRFVAILGQPKVAGMAKSVTLVPNVLDTLF